MTHAVHGAALHAPGPGRLEAWDDCLIVISDDGRISAVHGVAPAELAEQHAADGTLTSVGEGGLLLPGLVDLHIHAPQFPQLGTALDLSLEQWLLERTFPLEARFADPAYAAQVYDDLVTTLLANGTTTAVYFGSRHLPATKILAETCLRHGQRALVGRTAMDHPATCPDFYRDPSPAVAADETRALIDHIRALPDNDRVLPVITPRFIPACTDDLLQRLGALAAETGCHVQTHVSESDWEHGHVAERCGCSDTEALNRFGLLTRRSVLAHANFLGDADFSTIHAAGAGIAHCPLSNVYFANAVFPLREALDRGVHVGLGTDIAGGASAALLDSARMAITASRSLEGGVDATVPVARRGRAGARIDATAALWLATAGGGSVLDLPIGLFEAGFQFDAIQVTPAAAGSNLRWHAADTAAQRLERIVHTAARADISAVWVGGRRVR